jgi:hypothetical protein
MTTAVDTNPMTREEAALQMQLLGHDFFLLANTETARTTVPDRCRSAAVPNRRRRAAVPNRRRRAAVPNRRHDGNPGLIDAAG